jgi:hypothetical protein
MVKLFKLKLDQADRLSDEQYRMASEILPHFFSSEKVDEDWLNDTTEKWCQDRAIHNAIMESISIIDGKHETLTKGALPDLLSKALGVGFDNNVGHDYTENAEQRYEFYHTEKNAYLSTLNTSTKLQKEVYRLKRLTSLLQVLVWVSLSLCVIWLLLL